jgi:hypothetical protein
MTIEIVDIEKLRKMNMTDKFIGCFMDHVLRENGGMLPERRKNPERVQPVRRGILQVQVRFPPSAQGGKGRIEGL